MIKIQEVKFKDSLVKEMARPVIDTDKVSLWWLGQAGFAFRFRKSFGLIDPYLSEITPLRMMAAPLKPADIRNLDLVFCTHAHLDHMDPETLPVLSEYNPSCNFIIPRAELDRAIKIGLPRNRIQAVNAGESFSYNPDIKVKVLAASHEEIKVNERGEHYFLGFILKFGHISLYHSGDCIPYEGLEEALGASHIDVALLPINGRDGRRRKLNILGNFTFAEAMELCRRCKIPVMMAHHFGMFAGNTVEVEEIRKKIRSSEEGVKCLLPKLEVSYLLFTDIEDKTTKKG